MLLHGTLIACSVSDPREIEFPDIGLVELEDAETVADPLAVNGASVTETSPALAIMRFDLLAISGSFVVLPERPVIALQFTLITESCAAKEVKDDSVAC